MSASDMQLSLLSGWMLATHLDVRGTTQPLCSPRPSARTPRFQALPRRLSHRDRPHDLACRLVLECLARRSLDSQSRSALIDEVDRLAKDRFGDLAAPDSP